MKKLFFLLGAVALMSATYCKKNSQGSADNTETPRTLVPDALVGAWECGAIDFARWENYQEGYWAGRNAVPTREAMVFNKNGDAKFYRYEFAFGVYEELIDCTGTVTFNNDGTFTFYPVRGRKRYISARHSEDNTDKVLKGSELNNPKIAGKRGYAYTGNNPTVMQITVPGSAPYNWYKKP